MLQCHPQTVYRSQDLPSIDIPGIGIRFNSIELEKFLERRTQHTHSLMAQLESHKTIILKDIAKFDKLYLKSNKGGNCGPMSGKKARWNYGFGVIYVRKTKQGRDRWYVDYWARGRRSREVVKGAQSRADAVLHLQEKVKGVFGESHSTAKKNTYTFAELAERYLLDYAKVMKRSFKSDLYIVNAHLVPHFGSLQVGEIGCLLLEKYRTERVGDGVKKSTVNRELAILSKIFSLGIDWGFAFENPVKKIKFFSEQDCAKTRILSDDEEVRLFEACPGYLRVILEMALNTGMRRGEVLNLRWSQVDFQNRTIRAEKTKSGKDRYIPLNSELLKALLELHAKRRNDDYVFTNPETGGPFKDVKRAFKTSCRKASISGLRFHDLRHTFASRLVERGVDLITVKELLGHSTVKMTERYTHPYKEHKQMAVELLMQPKAKGPGSPSNVAQGCHTDGEKASGQVVKPPLSIN